MLKPGSLFVTIALCVFLHACQSATSPTPAGYAGEWSGTTFQGSPMTFTVSSDQKVTAIAVGYNFNGCSGVSTFSNLNVTIGNPGGPAAPIAEFVSGAAGATDSTAVHFFFTSSTTANGSVLFIAYTNCGNAGGTWAATKR